MLGKCVSLREQGEKNCKLSEEKVFFLILFEVVCE